MKKIILLTLTALCAVGCKKFLEPTSQGEYIPSTAEQLSGLLLSALPEPNEKAHNALTRGYFDVMSDDVQVRDFILGGAAVFSYQLPFVSAIQNLFTWQPDYGIKIQQAGYGSFDRVYEDTYVKLAYVNSVLDYVDKVSGTQNEKDYVKAQALALRGLYYLNLVNFYGQPYCDGRDGMGIPLRLKGHNENRPMVRNSVGECYDQIAGDLEESVRLFATLHDNQQYREYRPTLPMAQMLLARTYLYMERWGDAERTAQELINQWGSKFAINDLNTLVDGGVTNYNPATPLLQNMWANFTDPKNNKDVIWCYGHSTDLIDLSGKTLSQLPLTMKNGTFPGLLQASADLLGTFDANDLRLRTYLVRDLYDYSGGQTPAQFKYKAYGKLKIIGDATAEAGGSYQVDETALTAWGYTLRITEAWLIVAEAQAMQNNAQARQTLQKVQEKRFAGGAIPASYTTASIINDVRAERRREFCFEGLRWNDLRRWGQAAITHTWYDVTRTGLKEEWKLSEKNAAFTIPMPNSLLLANPDMTQVPLGGGKK